MAQKTPPPDPDELFEVLFSKSPSGRLEWARVMLARFEAQPGFANLPDCEAARRDVKLAGELCHLKQWNRADRYLTRFEASVRPILYELRERQRHVNAGKKSGDARRAKGDAVRARFALQLKRGLSEQNAKNDCMKFFEIQKRQLTDYLKRR